MMYWHWLWSMWRELIEEYDRRLDDEGTGCIIDQARCRSLGLFT